MKKTKMLEFVMAGALAFALFGCSLPTGGLSGNGGGNGGGGNSNNAADDQPITGSLSEDTTWPGRDANGESITYFINSTYSLKNGCDLVIQEGAIVKFGPTGGITVNKTESLTATGVIFTSAKDSRGRRINCAGDSEPSPGDWKQIKIYGGTGSFKNCEFSYGGNNCSTLYVVKNTTEGKAKVDACIFSYNDGTNSTSDNVNAALEFESSVDHDPDKTYVKNSTFKNNVWPLSLPADLKLDASNTFGTSNTDKNKFNYIHFNTTSIYSDVVWAKQDVPYFIVGSTIQVGQDTGKSGTLTIKAGENSSNPNIICFATTGIMINKLGKLDVEDNVTFRNSPESENTYFKGLYCATYREWHTPGVAGNSITRKVILLPSGSIKIINYSPTEDNYKTSDPNFDKRSAEIQHSNYYAVFEYDYTN